MRRRDVILAIALLATFAVMAQYTREFGFLLGVWIYWAAIASIPVLVLAGLAALVRRRGRL